MNATPDHDPNASMRLRQRANSLLQAKSAGLSVAQDAGAALRVLFELASCPDTAHDALALLHELQVHQVELDLQNEELLASRAEQESAWDRQRQLHDASPSAQLVLDASGRLQACNAQALHSLQAPESEVLGKPLGHWLSAPEASQVHHWLSQAMHSPACASRHLSLRRADGAAQQVVASARANPLASGVLLAWIELPLAPTTAPHTAKAV